MEATEVQNRTVEMSLCEECEHLVGDYTCRCQLSRDFMRVGGVLLLNGDYKPKKMAFGKIPKNCGFYLEYLVQAEAQEGREQ